MMKKRLIKLFMETHINDLEVALSVARERMPNSAKKERALTHTHRVTEAAPCKRGFGGMGSCSDESHYTMEPSGEYRALEPLRVEIEKLREDFEKLFEPEA